MNEAMGKKLWAIPEGYIPETNKEASSEIICLEIACIVNTGDREANIEITIYFSDREPTGPYKLKIQPQRTLHLRFNELNNPQEIPRDTEYASIIKSDVPVIVQHARLDSRQAENALLSTMAYPVIQ